jgi:hypothetical protein
VHMRIGKPLKLFTKIKLAKLLSAKLKLRYKGRKDSCTMLKYRSAKIVSNGKYISLAAK